MKRLIFLSVAAGLLGGCQFFGGRDFSNLAVRPVGQEESPAAALAYLDAGKQHLTRGELADAIQCFRRATLDPATGAGAFNGLAIAYARLGRGDLAKRYFREAIARAPEDPKYAANLSRYYQSRDAALAKSGEAAGANDLAIAVPSPGSPDRSGREYSFRSGSLEVQASASPTNGRLTKVSSRELSLRTLPVAEPGAKSASASAASGYPVRVAFSGAPEQAHRARDGKAQSKGTGGEAATAGYPVRIVLSDR